MRDYAVSGALRKKDFKLKFCKCVYSLLSFAIIDKKLAFNEPKKGKASLLRLGTSLNSQYEVKKVNKNHISLSRKS